MENEKLEMIQDEMEPEPLPAGERIPKRKSRFGLIVGALYPVVIHLILGEGIIWAAYLIPKLTGSSHNIPLQDNILVLTGLNGLLAGAVLVPLYLVNQNRRRQDGVIPGDTALGLSFGEGILLLLMGICLSVYTNLLMTLLSNYISSESYQAVMEAITANNSPLAMLFWVGWIAPMAEEIVFRWMVFLHLRDHLSLLLSAWVSAIIFGVYHGNVLQAIYASILGVCFALLLEYTGSLISCMLLHIGANSWSLLLDISFERAGGSESFALLEKVAPILGAAFILLLPVTVWGFHYFRMKYRMRDRQRLI